MKNSTKILGIFLALILIIILISLFIAKAYIDSKDISTSSFEINKNFLPDFSDEFEKQINFDFELSEIKGDKNIEQIEDEFFKKADNYISKNTKFEIVEKKQIPISSLEKDLTLNINITKALIVFSDSSKPKISYKFYYNKEFTEPIKVFNDKILFLDKMLDKKLDKKDNLKENIYLFAFVILPNKYNNLYIDSNVSSINIFSEKLETQNLFNIKANASKLDIESKSLNATNGEFELTASKMDLESNDINFSNLTLFKLNASKIDFQSNSLNTNYLNLDFNVSTADIEAENLSINSQLEINENASKLNFETNNFKNFPKTFNYKANVSTSYFSIKNCKAFSIKSKVKSSNIYINQNDETHRFTSDFELDFNPNKIDEKNILKINIDSNMTKIEFDFD